MIFPAVILEPVILEGQSPDRNGGDRIRRYRIIVVTSLMMAVGLIAGGFLYYNMGGASLKNAEIWKNWVKFAFFDNIKKLIQKNNIDSLLLITFHYL